MKKIIISIFAALLFSACNKTEKRIADEITTDQLYKATDGTRAKVTFESKNDGRGTMTIKANGKSFQLDKISGAAGSDMYGRNGITARVTTDSVIINQDNTVIELAKDLH